MTPTQQIYATRRNQGELGRDLDDQIDHSVIAPLDPKTPEDRAIHRTWNRDPGEADIQGVDTKGLTPTPPPPPGSKPPKPPKTPTSVKTEKGIAWVHEGNNVTWAVIGGTKKMRDDVVKNAQHNFNKAERQNFNRVIIQIGKADSAMKGAAGYYQNAIKYSKSKPVRDVLDKFPPVDDPRLKAHKKLIKELEEKQQSSKWYVRVLRHGGSSYDWPTTNAISAAKEAEEWRQKISVTKATVIAPKKGVEFTEKDMAELMASRRLVGDIVDTFHYIKLGRKYYDGGTPTHELIHHLRMSRPSENFSGHVPHYGGKDADLEESTTDLETIGRHNPWIAGPLGASPGKLGRPTRSGYYQDIARTVRKSELAAAKKTGTYAAEFKEYDNIKLLAEALENQDRALLVQGKNNKKLTDKQVKLALAKVQKNPEKYINAGIKSPPLPVRLDNRYKQTIIAELGKNGIGGKQERVDRYFAALDPEGKETTKLHMKGAGQAKNAPAAKKILSSTPGKGTIVEYHDGKPKVIGRFNNAEGGPPVRGYELAAKKPKRSKRGLYL